MILRLENSVLGLLFLSLGCAHVVMTAPEPAMDTVIRLRNGHYQSIRLGSLRRGTEVTEAMDRKVAIRGANWIKPPAGSTFSQMIEQTLAQDLLASGLLNPDATMTLDGTLSRMELQGGFRNGSASMTVHWVLTRAGAVLYDKDLTVSDLWTSSVSGEVAIPRALRHYQGIFPKMAAALLDDKELLGVLAH